MTSRFRLLVGLGTLGGLYSSTQRPVTAPQISSPVSPSKNTTNWFCCLWLLRSRRFSGLVYWPEGTVIGRSSTTTKPIPRWDVHFGTLKTAEGTPRLLILLLGTDWVITAGRFSDMYISPRLQFSHTFRSSTLFPLLSCTVYKPTVALTSRIDVSFPISALPTPSMDLPITTSYETPGTKEAASSLWL